MRKSLKLGGLILGTALMSGVAGANAINPDHSVGFSSDCPVPVVHHVVYHHFYRPVPVVRHVVYHRFYRPVYYRYYTPVTYRYYRTCSDGCFYNRPHFLFW